MKKIINTLIVAILMLDTATTFAQALNFGAYSYVTIGTVLSSNHSYTKEAWVRVYPTGAVHGRNIISAYDHPFWIENGLLSAANNYGSNPVSTVHDAQQFPLSTWVHVAVTYDASSFTMKLYRDGSLVASTTSAPTYYSSVMQIGATNYGDFLDGTDVDEARVWSVALSQAEIQANMNCDMQGRANLLAYYKFDEGTPAGNNTNLSYATDYSGNGNNGSFANFNMTGNSNNYITGRTVNTVASISGSGAVCPGGTVTLSDATSGGTWSSSNTAIATVGSTGIVTGVSGGNPVITYTASNGCIATKTVTINAAPVVTATVTDQDCSGMTGGTSATISANFNGTAIASTKKIWFSSVVKINGSPTYPLTIYFVNQTITSSAFNLSVPNATLILDNAYTTATTTFNGYSWVTTAPPNQSGNYFISGYADSLTSAISGGLHPVSWNGTFYASRSGVSVKWQWAAAVYSSFNTNLDNIGVKPSDCNSCSGYANSDHAGTPESYKSNVIGGAMGGGASNYTGGLSGTLTVSAGVSTSSPDNGSITTSVSGGASPYTYAWNTGATTSSVSNLAVGSYTTTVTDHNGCSSSNSWSIDPCAAHKMNEDNGAALSSEATPEIKVYPNPSSSTFTIEIPSKNVNTEVTVAIYSMTGALVETRNISDDGTTMQVSAGTQLPAGMYIMQIRQGDDSKMVKLVKN